MVGYQHLALQHMHFATHALCKTCTLHYDQFACYVHSAIYIEPSRRIRQMDQLDRSA